jgi:NAD-dependent SIR2 family protein deacetylase
MTVEMHGSVRQLVCPACGRIVKLSPPMARTLKAKKPLACGACGHAPLRMRLMLYDDAEGESFVVATYTSASARVRMKRHWRVSRHLLTTMSIIRLTYVEAVQ